MDRVDRIIGAVTLVVFSTPMFLAPTWLYVKYTDPSEMLLPLLAYHIVARICMMVQFGFSISGPDWLPDGVKFFSTCWVLGFWDVAAVMVTAFDALHTGIALRIQALYLAEVILSGGYVITMLHLARYAPDEHQA